jgi:hypothetical protein
MDVNDEIQFLILLRDKVDLLIPKIAVNDPLIEMSAMLTSRIEKLSEEQPDEDAV